MVCGGADRSQFLCCAKGLCGASSSDGPSQTQQTLSVPADSPRWDLQGQAKAAEYQGRKCLFLDGGAAVLKDFEMRDGVVDVDVATPASRGSLVSSFGSPTTAPTPNGFISASTSPALPTRCSTRRFSTPASTGKSIMGRASPARSIFRKMSGSTCAWRWWARRQSSMSRTWTSPRS